MPQFYADEQFPFPVVELLRALGHDVLTVQEAENADQGISDEEVLAFLTFHGIWKTSLLFLSPTRRSHCVGRRATLVARGVRDFEFSPFPCREACVGVRSFMGFST